MADIDIAIGLDTKEATQNLSSFKSKMQQDLGGLEKSFGSFAKLGASIAAGFAALKIGQFLSEGIRDAIEAEKSLAKLANQLKVTGEFSEAAVREFDEFAGAVERATNVSAEAVLEQTALAKSFGLTNEESKNLVRAATQLSAVTGDSLSTSVDTLLKSYQGQSRQLSLVIGETANLTKEQLRNGDAIDLINAKYGGTAEAALNTFGGALTALERSFGDIAKEIGTNIIQSQSLITTIKQLENVFSTFNKSISGSALTSIIDATIKSVLLVGEAFAKTFGFIDRIVSGVVVVLQRINLAVGFLSGKFLDLQEAVRGPNVETSILKDNLEALKKEARESLAVAESAFLRGENAANQFGEELAKARAEIGTLGKEAVATSNTINRATNSTRAGVRPEEIERAKQSFKSLSNEIFQSVATETEKVNAKRREQIEQLESIRKLEIISLKEFSDTKIRINEAAEKQITEITQREADKRALEQKRQGAGGVGASGAAGVDGIDGTIELNADAAEKALVSGLSTGANVITAALNGRDGAVQMASTIGAGVADKFLPGFGQAVGPLITALSQDSETIRESTKEFVAAIPDLVLGILEGLYIVIELLVKGIAKAFLDGVKAIARGIGLFFAGVGKFLSGFTEATGKAFSGLGAIFEKAFGSIGRFFENIGEKIFNALSDGAQALVDSVGDLFQGIIDGFANLFKPITDLFSNIGIGGGEGGLFGGSVIPGFLAEGGVVPPGFPNDTYPAFLTSGETVVPAAKPLPEMSSENSGVMVALLGQILNKLSEPMQVSTTAEVNGRALADIILQLNRNSARLA
jgi:hypothetical protein